MFAAFPQIKFPAGKEHIHISYLMRFLPATFRHQPNSMIHAIARSCRSISLMNARRPVSRSLNIDSATEATRHKPLSLHPIAFLILIVCGFCAISMGATPVTAVKSTPVKTIFDTDMQSDCDDCGALATLHKLADLGEADILACVVNSPSPECAIAATVDAINIYYGRPQIPIGTYHVDGRKSRHSAYTAKIRDEFPHAALPDDQEPTALSVYRTALAAAPNSSVTIISVGFFTNLYDLLKSPPDAASPMSGPDLIRAKVKQLVAMGGQYPKSPITDCNFSAPNTQYVVANWPTPILFSGCEIGNEIITGKSLASTPTTNPVRRAYELHGNLRGGRQSWDLTAVLAAVRDPHLYWEVSPSGACNVFGGNKGNEWVPAPDSGHTYLIKKLPSENVAKILDNLMSEPPTHKEALNK